MHTGTFVYGKYRVKAVGSKQKRLLPSNEWKRIPNHHEAIVTIEEYEQVQSMKGSDNSGLKFLEGNSEVAEITDELLDELLERIVVYADKNIELRWKFSNRSN